MCDIGGRGEGAEGWRPKYTLKFLMGSILQSYCGFSEIKISKKNIIQETHNNFAKYYHWEAKTFK